MTGKMFAAALLAATLLSLLTQAQELQVGIATAGSIFSFPHEFHRLIQRDGG